MNDVLTIIASPPRTEFDWEAYYLELETYLQPEGKIQFWRCRCGETNAVVVGESRGRCTKCDTSTPTRWMEPVNGPVI